MRSPEFERVKEQCPGAAWMLDCFGKYIQAQTAVGQKYIVPKLAAAALRLSDSEAFTMLELLAYGGVLYQVYNVYCRRHDTLLDTVSPSGIDEVFHCDFCDTDHGPSSLKFEIAFKPVIINATLSVDV